MGLQPQLQSNRTLSILKKAEEGKYGIVALCCYDQTAVLSLVRAAERLKAPAIIQIFPVTMHYGGKPFLRFCLDAAHSASVPISVHLDHATTDEDISVALTFAEEGCAFDSIMVDCSHADTDEENIELAKGHIARATAVGVAVEAELGRLEGGEAGLRVISDAQLTNPSMAERFMSETGATILAPSIGNLHGRYLKPPQFKFDLLNQLHGIVKKQGHYICMHGTDDLKDEVWRECVDNGATKFNINSWVRDPIMESIAAGLAKGTPLPDLYEEATEVGAKVNERFMHLLGSAGKAA